MYVQADNTVNDGLPEGSRERVIDGLMVDILPSDQDDNNSMSALCETLRYKNHLKDQLVIPSSLLQPESFDLSHESWESLRTQLLDQVRWSRTISSVVMGIMFAVPIVVVLTIPPDGALVFDLLLFLLLSVITLQVNIYWYHPRKMQKICQKWSHNINHNKHARIGKKKLEVLYCDYKAMTCGRRVNRTIGYIEFIEILPKTPTPSLD